LKEQVPEVELAVESGRRLGHSLSMAETVL